MSSCYDQTIRDFWTFTTEESTLLPGMTDKGRLGFATQLKFIDIHGRSLNTTMRLIHRPFNG